MNVASKVQQQQIIRFAKHFNAKIAEVFSNRM